MRLSSTAASKGFSELLTRVADGESVEIERHGQTVAVVVPPQRGYLRGDALLALLDRLPVVDTDFAADVHRLRDTLLPPSDPWES